MPNVESLGGCMSASYQCFSHVENGASIVVSNGKIEEIFQLRKRRASKIQSKESPETVAEMNRSPRDMITYIECKPTRLDRHLHVLPKHPTDFVHADYYLPVEIACFEKSKKRPQGWLPP